MKRIAPHLFTALLTLMTAPTLLAQEEGGGEAAETAGGSTSLLDLILQGGWAMIPLGLVCLAMFYLVFYCWMETAKKKFLPEAILPKLTGELQMRDVATATATLSAAPSVLSRSLSTALNKARPDWEDCNKEKVAESFVEVVEGEESSVNQWINYLNVVAAVSPMIGLLGTVSGMIGAFQTIGDQGMGDPSALAGDIGQALITTATGLVIAIPAMIFYFFYKNRLSTQMTATVQTASVLLDHMAGEIGGYEEEEYEYATE